METRNKVQHAALGSQGLRVPGVVESRIVKWSFDLSQKVTGQEVERARSGRRDGVHSFRKNWFLSQAAVLDQPGFGTQFPVSSWNHCYVETSKVEGLPPSSHPCL